MSCAVLVPAARDWLDGALRLAFEIETDVDADATDVCLVSGRCSVPGVVSVDFSTVAPRICVENDAELGGRLMVLPSGFLIDARLPTDPDNDWCEVWPTVATVGRLPKFVD